MLHEGHKHYIAIKARSPFFRHYAFLDTAEYLADQLFIQDKVRVYFGREAHRPDDEYRVVFCKVRKRDEPAFLAALQKLPSKMLLTGHTNYPDACEEFQRSLSRE